MGNGVCFVDNSDGFCEGAERGNLDSGENSGLMLGHAQPNVHEREHTLLRIDLAESNPHNG